MSDPALPFDELERELPHALEFGTKDPRYFASAEVFDVASVIVLKHTTPAAGIVFSRLGKIKKIYTTG